MILIVVRHAKAEEPGEFSGVSNNDWLRPLTDEGKARMTKIAHKMQSFVPTIDLIVASPLTRAQQTAGIIQEAYGLSTVETESNLAPGGSKVDFVKFLQDQEHSVVCAVGHEPSAGELCSFLLSGQGSYFVPMKKSSICILEFPGQVREGKALLIAKLDPSHLIY